MSITKTAFVFGDVFIPSKIYTATEIDGEQKAIDAYSDDINKSWLVVCPLDRGLTAEGYFRN